MTLRVIAVGIVSCWAALGQLQFEAADVHRSASATNPQSYRSGGFLRGERYDLRKATMLDLIRLAYGFEPDNVLGGPDWLALTRFDVAAKAPASTSPQDLRLMLQSLLVDRFALVLHKDVRPVAAFALKLGKDKAKLKKAEGPGEAECKYLRQLVYACRNMTMAGFAQQLRGMAGDYLGDPVVDATGLTGAWDFDLQWTSRSRILPGLRLTAEKIPADVIVIDAINEKPTVSDLLPPRELQFEVASGESCQTPGCYSDPLSAIQPSSWRCSPSALASKPASVPPPAETSVCPGSCQWVADRISGISSGIMLRLPLLLSLALPLLAQDPPPQEPPPAEAPAAAAAPALPAARNADPQPYNRVITKDAKTSHGLFTVHQVRDRYYYEIPRTELGREFLLNVRIAKTTIGAGYGGDEASDLVVRWELNGNRVNLRRVNYSVTADPKEPIALAVKAANNDAIVMTFPVAAFSKDEAPVVEVSRLFSTDMPEFNVRQRLNATATDASRSYIERISPYPENIEAESTLTYTRAQAPANAANAPAAAGGMRPGSSASVVLHYSMVKLPEKPMMPRLFDERVGFFTTATEDYSKEEHRAARVRYIARWRLEKKDPTAEVSEPVKPIVYYIDAATPMQWREWLKKGIEDWQPAFEAAGFKNAIVARMAPTHEEDPNFSPEDVRYSVIRWMPSTTENASGPHISDPRTGEILNADIIFYHNVMNLQRDWYFLQVGPLDPRAKKLPLPDDLMGRLLEFVVAHEVGHTLGLQHNMKASSLYPQEKVRDKNWIHTMGHAPSIMDYSRFNYVAQPEDGIPVADLVPRIGPYDIFAMKWGYTPIADAKTSEEERATLDKWARVQDTTPWLRFSTAGAAGSDFGELTEAVGDADAIKSTAMGVKNLQRVAKMLLPATTSKTGEPYEDLSELYGRMLGQWTLEMNHVAAIVGAFNSQTKYVGQEGRVFTPVSKDRQRQAMNFLAENAFATPRWAIDPEIMRRIEPTGGLNRIRNAQSSVLTNLLSSARFARLVEQEAVDGPSAYTPAEFLGTARKAVWRELDSTEVRVDAYRRNLQRAWLDLANSKVNSNLPAAVEQAAGNGDEKPFYRAELRDLSDAIAAALGKASDRETRAHLEGARDQIARILDPKFNQGGGAAAPVIRIGLDGVSAPETCWPDYAILP